MIDCEEMNMQEMINYLEDIGYSTRYISNEEIEAMYEECIENGPSALIDDFAYVDEYY